jgi:ADP-ribosylglycohydrolase/fructose-1,6-bisphosphatase/inositol monophosphatase family enzyme
MPESYSQQLACALIAARQAGDLLRTAFHDGYPGDLDKAAELLIRKTLLDAYPKYGYVGEETGAVPSRHDASRHLWLVDPMDGTEAATHGFRSAAVSIALLRDGLPVLGVVFAYAAPDHAGDLFHWTEGMRGVIRNGRHIVRDWAAEPSPSRTVLISQAGDHAAEHNAKLVAPMRYRTVPGIAYRLALVAAGEADVGVSQNSPVAWDLGAGHALLLGAGGNLFDANGSAVTYNSEGWIRTPRTPVYFGGQQQIVGPLIPRDWSKPRQTPNKLCYLKSREVITDPGILNRAQGCLLGQVGGDSLGSLVEFQPAAEIAGKYPDGPRLLADGGTWNTLAGQPTDDSELALMLARSIIESHGFDEESAARAYVHWYQSGPFDIGSTTRSALGPASQAVKRGLTMAEVAKAAGNGSSQANGALMRVSPLGIYGTFRPPEEIFEFACADATLTHPHTVCQHASGVFAATIAHAIRHGARPEAAYQFALATARKQGVEASVMEALQTAAARPPDDFYSQQGWVLKALQNAFYQLLHAQFEEGVVNTVRSGGDTDTNGAIAGALLGAVHGRGAVPQQWMDRVLTCRPIAGLPGIGKPRPMEFWPVDALALAERLLLAGG